MMFVKSLICTPAMWTCGNAPIPGPALASHTAPSSWHVCRSEKNWAFLEQDDQLTILYTMLPCTSIFTFDPASAKGAQFQRGLCYDDKEVS